MGFFIQSRKYISLKFTGELYVVTMKNDAKFEQELTCQLEIDMRNLTNLDPSTQKSQKFALLMDCFWLKYIMFELNKYRVLMFDGTEYWCKHWRKTDLWFLKWHEEFGRFSPEYVWKSENWDFYRAFLSKVENVWA